MTCTICKNDGNIKTMYNDCIIESLEKIKFHYLSLKSKLCENEELTKNLKKQNDELTKIVTKYEQIEKNQIKQNCANYSSCQDNDTDSDISFSQSVAAKSIEQKSDDDLNKALNFEDEFELSFIPGTQVTTEKKKLLTAGIREPLKVLPAKTQLENKPLNIKQESIKSNNEIDKQCNQSVNVKKSSSPSSSSLSSSSSSLWISKENELKKSVLGSSHVQKKSNRSLRHIKQENKVTSLSLKQGKLRQTRLQLDISKNLSSNFSDTTFCDEAIEASPNADSSLKRINSSKQWQLRNISSKITKSDDESVLDFTNCNPKKSGSQSPPALNKSLDTSSVVMCTPASQDIIFLDDSSESMNIESMDLMNPSENLSSLKRIELNGIKKLQKINSGQTPSKISDEKPNNPKTPFKSEHEFVRPKAVDRNESKKPLIDDKATNKENSNFEKNKSDSPPVKRARKFDIDCHECQTYIKYLGARLTDEQIEQHIRSCTNHKKPINNNLTPDGFWDPIIKPFASDDPRNATIIDDPFV